MNLVFHISEDGSEISAVAGNHWENNFKDYNNIINNDNDNNDLFKSHRARKRIANLLNFKNCQY